MSDHDLDKMHLKVRHQNTSNESHRIISTSHGRLLTKKFHLNGTNGTRDFLPEPLRFRGSPQITADPQNPRNLGPPDIRNALNFLLDFFGGIRVGALKLKHLQY